MTRHIASREFDVMDGKQVLSSGEVRYTFSVNPGRYARTWANGTAWFAPAEPATVDLHQVEIRMHHSHPWRTVEGFAFDMLSSDVPDAWFIAQIEEQDA
jgi:hypothetical protein